MRIAVGSQNFRTITPHGGKTRRFLIYEAEPGAEPVEVDRLDLPRELSFHEFHGDGPHPVDPARLMIVGSAGERFVERMARRGITVVTTVEEDPAQAIRDYFAGRLAPGRPHE